MFKLNFRIVHSGFDDFTGQNGFFQIICNNYTYGEMFSEELEQVMDKVSLYDWFDRLIKVIKNLDTKEYVALSDVESYNTWIQFQRRNEDVIISIVRAEKEQGSRDIAYHLKNPVIGEWAQQVINYYQFKNEIVEKTKEYIKYILANNADGALIDKVKAQFGDLVQSVKVGLV